jgi:multiple sugar transport system ATP-binding protein
LTEDGVVARVKIEKLTKRFGEVVAVDAISAEIADGELTCMLGPSGCGKTTTLRIIAGLEQQDEGDIYIGDTLVNDLPPRDRDIGMVFQFYAMYPDKNVFEQLAFPLRMRKFPKEEINKRVKDVAEMLEIGNLLKEPVSRLTVGDRQKIEIGRAIVRQPQVYLFDEPLTNLDAKLRAQMRAELKRIQNELKTTTIYVTHDQLEAMILASRIAIMDKGKIVQYDTPDRLYERPSDLFVAGFIGTPPMNFVDCTLTRDKDEYRLDAGDFKYDVTDMAELIRKSSAGSELILGIRPEDLRITERATERDTVEMKVDILEPLGSRMIVNLTVGRHYLKANTRAMPLKPNEKVKIVLDRNKIHIFDKKTSTAIV